MTPEGWNQTAAWVVCGIVIAWIIRNVFSSSAVDWDQEEDL